jgi:hypothetical protein
MLDTSSPEIDFRITFQEDFLEEIGGSARYRGHLYFRGSNAAPSQFLLLGRGGAFVTAPAPIGFRGSERLDDDISSYSQSAFVRKLGGVGSLFDGALNLPELGEHNTEVLRSASKTHLKRCAGARPYSGTESGLDLGEGTFWGDARKDSELVIVFHGDTGKRVRFVVAKSNRGQFEPPWRCGTHLSPICRFQPLEVTI